MNTTPTYKAKGVIHDTVGNHAELGFGGFNTKPLKQVHHQPCLIIKVKFAGGH